MLDNLTELSPEKVVSKILEFRNNKYRFVTMTAAFNADSNIDVIYSFDKNYKLYNVKTTVEPGSEIKSISTIYLCAAFAENEISEQFGIKFNGLVVDYGGHFMLPKDAPESPFGDGIIIERKGGNRNAG